MPTNSIGYVVVLRLEEYVRVSVVEDRSKREINMFGSDDESKKNGVELSSFVCRNVGVGWGEGRDAQSKSIST